MNLTILCDLDSTLSQFNEKLLSEIHKRWGFYLAAEDNNKWDMLELLPDLPRDEYLAMFDEPGFCLDIEPNIMAINCFAALKDCGHRIYIVTASSPNMVPDKTKWVQKHMPWFATKDMIFTHHKHLLKGDVLIDDGPHNVEAYRKAWPSSLILMPAYPYNVIADEWADMNFDKENWTGVYTRIETESARRAYIAQGCKL